MKTAIQIKNQHAELIAKTNKAVNSKKMSDRPTKTELNKIMKHIEFLHLCHLYLITNPTQQFIEKMQDDLERKIKLVDDKFQDELEQRSKVSTFNPKSESFKDYKKQFYTNWDYKNLNEQLKMIKYILSDIVV